MVHLTKLPKSKKLRGEFGKVWETFWQLVQWGAASHKKVEGELFPKAHILDRRLPETHTILYEYKPVKKPRYAQKRTNGRVKLARVLVWESGAMLSRIL